MRPSEQTHGLDAEIARLAERQYGVVGRGQLVGLGMSGDAIKRRLGAGHLHRLHAGVYSVGHRVVPREGRWLAAVLASGAGAVLSHHSAAALWGIRSPRSGPTDVTSPRKSRSGGSIRRHCARLPADEVTSRSGIPLTTVPRTVFDLAALAPGAVEPALRQSEYLRLHDALSLRDLLERHPGHRGNRAVRAALERGAEAAGHTRSALEERFLSFLDRHRLPRPQLNAWIVLGSTRFQVDCLWPDRRQVVELDGRAAHDTRTAVLADKTRDRRLQTAGYSVTRIAWSHLDVEPASIAADLRALLIDAPRNHT